MRNLTDDSFGLIKFGKESWLKNIKKGKLWFRTLEYYQEYEDNENIGDRNEGISHIIYPNKDVRLYYSYSLNGSTKCIDYSNSTVPFFLFPKYNKQIYIFCLSYLSVSDIINKTIFDDSKTELTDWDSVFFLLDPAEFINMIKISLASFNVKIAKIQYFDYNTNQYNINYFIKSNKYKHQKEIRIAFCLSDKMNQTMTSIDDNTIEINLNKDIEGIIIPTNSFRDGFLLEKKERKNDIKTI
jgi:hypothetical protein